VEISLISNVSYIVVNSFLTSMYNPTLKAVIVNKDTMTYWKTVRSSSFVKDDCFKRSLENGDHGYCSNTLYVYELKPKGFPELTVQ